MTEEEAIRRCQAGDPEAFRFLVERYKGVLYGTAYAMTGNRTVAEDQVQEAFLSAWNGIGGFQIGRPLKPWLVRILVNRVMNYRRSAPQRNEHIEWSEAQGPAATDPAEDVERKDHLERALVALSATVPFDSTPVQVNGVSNVQAISAGGSGSV